jgi:hypothetical protein
MPSEGNSTVILTAEKSGWLIEKELQNRFRPKCEMESGIWGLMTGWLDSRAGNENWDTNSLGTKPKALCSVWRHFL